MSRLLVTGAFGLLGSSLAPMLVASGHEVVTAGRSGQADIQLALGDGAAVMRCLAQVEPDVVINLAAITDVDQCERDPQFAFLGNVRIVENLSAAIAALKQAPHLIQISTDHVYDGPAYQVEDNVTLRNYYAYSKYSGELAARGISSTVLRTNFFGRSATARRSSFSDWLVDCLVRREPIRVFEDVFFSPLSLATLCNMIELVVRRQPRGVFNLGARGGLSKADFAFALARVLGLHTQTLTRSSYEEARMATRRPKDMRMDSSHFEAALGVRLPDIDTELNSMKDHYHEG